MDVKEAGSLGGKASAQNLTPDQRKQRATNAVRAREAKRKQRSLAARNAQSL